MFFKHNKSVDKAGKKNRFSRNQNLAFFASTILTFTSFFS